MSLYIPNTYNLPTYDSQILNEGFIGKTKLLLELEDCIEKLRKKYIKASKFTPLVDVMKLAEKDGFFKDPLYRKIPTILEKQFGFESLYFFMMGDPMPNACAFPLLFNGINTIEEAIELVTHKNGLRFTKKANVHAGMAITAGLFFDQNITSEEIVAVILHETGHLFEFVTMGNKKDNIFWAFPLLSEIAIIFLRCLNNKKGNVFDASVQFIATVFIQSLFPTFFQILRQNQKDPTLNYGASDAQLQYAIFLFLGLYEEAKKLGTGLLRAMSLGLIDVEMISDKINHVISNKVESLLVYSSTLSEKQADNFPTIFGYAKATMSIQHKFLNLRRYNYTLGIDPREVIASVPIIGHIQGLNECILSWIGSLTDEHPDSISRIKQATILLKKDLDDPNIPPKMKKEVIKELDGCEKFYEELTKIRTDKKTKIGFTDFSVQMQAFIFKFRDAIFGKDFTDITGTIFDKMGLWDKVKHNVDVALNIKKKSGLKEDAQLTYNPILCLDNDHIYRDYISLDEAVEEGKLFEYCVSKIYGNNLSFDERYMLRKEWDRCVITEDAPVDQSNTQSAWNDPTEILKRNKDSGISFDQVQQVYKQLAKQLQDKQDEQNRATAEKKGTFSTVIYQIKQAMNWVKNQMLKFKDKAMDAISNKEKGYHAFVRNVNKVNSLSGSNQPNQTLVKPSSGITNQSGSVQPNSDGTVSQGA